MRTGRVWLSMVMCVLSLLLSGMASAQQWAKTYGGTSFDSATSIQQAKLTSSDLVTGWVTMTETAKLTAADGAAADLLGTSVAIDGDTVVVGAKGANIGANTDRGAAYVFTRAGGVWTQQAKLTAADGAAADLLGTSVAIDGDTVVVGAKGANIGANTDRGAAYVFVKPATGWVSMTQTAKLTAADGAAADLLGTSVAISGDTVVVGAGEAKIGANAHQGAAYVFTRAGGVWTQQAKLTAADGAAADLLGTSVAIDGDTVVVGAGEAKIGANAHQGAAYVFVKPATGWVSMTQTAKLTAADGAANDLLGTSVAISGDTLVAGASWADGANAHQGAAYVFVKPATGWVSMTQTAKLTAADGAAADFLGSSVAIDGDTVVVGAFWADIGANLEQGAAYVFTRAGGVWTQQAKLTAADGAAADFLGSSVAIDGDTVVVGAPFADIGANLEQGAAYVFGSATTTAAWSGWSAVPGGGQSSSQPAAVVDSTGTLRLYIQGMENGLWVNSRSGSTWSGWSAVAGGGKSGSAPAVVLDGSAMRLVVRGLDDGIWTALADNPQWTSLGGRTFHSPAAVLEGSTLHLFVRGADGALYLNSRSGGSFSGWSAVPGGGQSSSGPAALLDGSSLLRLYLQGADNGLWVNTKSGSTWSGWSAVAGGGKSNSGPAVVLDGGSVRLVVRGLDDGIWTALADNPQWTALGGRTNDSPAAVLEGSTLYLFVRGADGALYLNSRTGGSSASERTPSLEQ